MEFSSRPLPPLILIPVTRESPLGKSWHYGYNDRSEVTTARKTFTTDPASTALKGWQSSYAYDAIGNRKSMVVTGETARTTNYTTGTGTTGQLNLYTGTAQPYGGTADGNLTWDGIWTYTWDAASRIVSISRPSGMPAGQPAAIVVGALFFDYIPDASGGPPSAAELLHGGVGGKLLGTALQPLMCKPCAINLFVCHGAANKQRLKVALANATGCKVRAVHGPFEVGGGGAGAPYPDWGNPTKRRDTPSAKGRLPEKAPWARAPWWEVEPGKLPVKNLKLPRTAGQDGEPPGL